MSQLADMHMSEQETDLLVQLKDLCAVWRTTAHRRNWNTSISVLLYTVSALPNEILITIFEMGYPYGLHIKASHVMRRWREVATNMPILWTSISIRGPQSLDQAETYLKRSQNCSLDIQFDFSRATNWLSLRDKERCITCCIPYVERWRMVAIKTYGPSQISIYDILYRFTCLSAPQLQSLKLKNIPSAIRSTSYQSSPVKVFTGGADALKRLDFSGFSMARCWPPLTAVTQLNFYQIEPVLLLSHFHDALRAMPCLARLRIQGQATQFLSNSVPSITIPSLKSLHIDCVNADYAAALFATLCTPSISSLILENMDKDTYAAFGRHLQHIPRYPMLQFIGFICADCMADDLDLISLLPTVTHLALHHVSNFVEQLSATSSLPGGNLVMPHLRTVTFLEPCYGTSILASICKLISIRKSIDLPIDTLRLAPHWNPSDPSINWLRENVILEIEDCEITSALLPYVY